ncbi:MAG: hypothetical protein BJ554DRAFT_7187 [Olpidium bornovanus]|uniref:Kinase n=1 Tax=Olpidium bornovanus TaxID=278681 RepID=A0A8H7ZWJ8_9FUNG|nr:MAG: hypothetical protein BJ554DRAFT_7187 [Olpidium bornovanus]
MADDLERRVRSARALEHQVAGHDGVLATADGLIVKPCTDTEVQFYRLVTATEEHRDVASFLPEFHGAVRLGEDGPRLVGPEDGNKREVQNILFDCVGGFCPVPDDASAHAVILENLLQGFRKPSVMDVKLGTQLYDEFCSEEKKERMREAARITTSLTLGLRITGMKVKRAYVVYDPSKSGYTVYDKSFGKGLTADNLHFGFSRYMEPAALRSSAYMRLVARVFLDRLVELHSVMLLKEFRMYASSVLFVFEGDPSPEHVSAAENDWDTSREGLAQIVALLKMIDFAHSYHKPGEGPDEGHLLGLSNAIKQFRNLLDR